MKKTLTLCALALLACSLTTSCNKGKSEAEIQAMVDQAAEKKVAEMEKQRELDEKLQRAEAIIAADEAKKAKPAPAITEPKTVVKKPQVVANIPGTRLAHVIREGGYTNARTGPGTDYPIMNKVKDGSDILYAGTLRRGGWVEVYNVNGDYLGYMSCNKIVP